MLFEKRSFSQECRVKMSPVIDLIEETLDNRSKIVGELMEDCLALKCDNLLAQGQSLFDGKVVVFHPKLTHLGVIFPSKIDPR